MANAKIINGLSVTEEILLINFSLSLVLKDDSINMNLRIPKGLKILLFLLISIVYVY